MKCRNQGPTARPMYQAAEIILSRTGKGVSYEQRRLRYKYFAQYYFGYSAFVRKSSDSIDNIVSDI